MKYIVILCLILAGCSSVKRVLKDPAKVEIVGREWEKKNPCTTDSFVKFISDTLVQVDTTIKYKFDTINNLQILKSIDTVLIKKTIRIKDTAKIYITDTRRLNIALDSINHYKGLSAYYKAQFEEQTAQTKQQKYRGNWWMIRFWLLFLAMLGLFYLYKKFN